MKVKLVAKDRWEQVTSTKPSNKRLGSGQNRAELHQPSHSLSSMVWSALGEAFLPQYRRRMEEISKPECRLAARKAKAGASAHQREAWGLLFVRMVPEGLKGNFPHRESNLALSNLYHWLSRYPTVCGPDRANVTPSWGRTQHCNPPLQSFTHNVHHC